VRSLVSFIFILISRLHPITKGEIAAAHRARYFSNGHEGGCQEETRTVRAIF